MADAATSSELIIPAGTFNNFARSLDLPLDPIEACRVILAENVRPTNVGFANGKPFFECLGTGLDAALYPIGEEIKLGRVHRLLDLMRRAYCYRRQKFVLAPDRDSTHSADVDYAELLPSLFELEAGDFCVALAGEPGSHARAEDYPTIP
jgi:hypothetical protein